MKIRHPEQQQHINNNNNKVILEIAYALRACDQKWVS